MTAQCVVCKFAEFLTHVCKEEDADAEEGGEKVIDEVKTGGAETFAAAVTVVTGGVGLFAGAVVAELGGFEGGEGNGFHS